MTGALRIDKTIMVAGINPSTGGNELLSVTTFDPPAERIDGIYMLAGIAPDGSNVLLRLNSDGTLGGGGSSLPTGGTTSQFLRGDETWNNTLIGPIVLQGATNTLTLAGSTAGNPVTLIASGADTLVDIKLVPQGDEGSVWIPLDVDAGDGTAALVLSAEPTMVRNAILADYTLGPLFIPSNSDHSITMLKSSDTSAFGSMIFLLRSGGVITAPTHTLTGLMLGELSFGGFEDDAGSIAYDSYAPVIYAFASDNWAADYHPGNIVFGTGDVNAGAFSQCSYAVLESAGRYSLYKPLSNMPQAASGVWSLPINYERAIIQWNSDVIEIGAAAGGSGTLRALRLLGTSVQVMGQFAANGATPAARPDYTLTNVTVDRTYDADTVLVAELADVVGTLIADLTAIGLLQ